MKQLRRLRQQIARITRVFRRRINRLSAAISRLRNDVNILQAQVSALVPGPGIREALLARLNTPIVIETDAGTISGTLIEVGIDYVAVLEPTGAIVLIPITKINSFI
ncbi:YuzF family protein [Paenibacillus alkaliterrae]|uniref:DUF2642 domain-containing protein n=1 Tax=Paenibacillus alkaliterrae TaxID=320909 RepID=UPI001F269946|nr:DUF2642 domain-containing protein [Paenibacillus alkaliterrae]MCF2941692.1 YuzF family protein [Paenibacillus alkaliterrae]